MAENVISLSADNAGHIADLLLQELSGKQFLIIWDGRMTFTGLEFTLWEKQIRAALLTRDCFAIIVNTVHLLLVYPVPAPGQPPVLFIFNPGEIRVEWTVNDQRSETVYKVVIEHLAPSGRPLRNVYQVIGPLE